MDTLGREKIYPRDSIVNPRHAGAGRGPRAGQNTVFAPAPHPTKKPVKFVMSYLRVSHGSFEFLILFAAG